MATFTITGQVKLRNDTAANWTSENPVLSQGEMGIETDTLKAKIGDGVTAWNSLGYAWGGVSPDKSRTVEFIKTTNTKAGAALTGVSQDSSLYDGKTIFLYLSYAAGTNATLDLTLADGTTTGAKPLYWTGTTRLTTHYGAGSVVSFTYVQSVDGWRRADYYSNSQGQYEFEYNTSYFKTAVVAESLAVGDSTGYVQATAGATFDISYPILWVTTAIAAGGTNYANTFVRHYDRNLSNVKQSFVGTPKKMVYMVITLSGCIATIDNEVITETLPSTEDGKIYLALGRMGNQSTGKNYFILHEMHPMYYYKDGAIREYSYIPNEYAKTSHEINNNRNVEYIVGTQTAATGAWRGVTQDTELYDGKLILYFLPCAGSGNATLELTFPDETTTGAIPVYLGSSGVNGTRMTTQLAVKTQGAPVLLAYDAKNNIWGAMQYWTDTNTYDRTFLSNTRVYAGTNKIMNYSLIMQKADGTWESFTTTSGTGTSKTKNTSGFRLGKIWRYNYNETINSGALTRNNYLFDCLPTTLTYSTNCGTTLVARKPVYLVGTIGSDGLFYLDNTWWTQTEPSTEDGKVYIYLGDAYSTTDIYFVANNPIYEYRNGAFRLYSNSKRITTTDIDEILAGQ